MEIGFNADHSAEFFFEYCKDVKVLSFDSQYSKCHLPIEPRIYRSNQNKFRCR